MTTEQDNSENAYSEWRKYLDQDEVIVWQGRPETRISWRGGEMGTVLLGGFIIAFISFFTWEAWYYSDGSEPDLGGNVVGLMIWIVIAFLLAISGPLGMAMVRRGTWYTLTDRRAIIAHWPQLLGFTVYRGLDSYPVTEVAVVPSDVRGLDTVQFSRLSMRSTFDEEWRPVNLGHSGNSRNHQIGFERITNAEHVAELCRKVQGDFRSREST